MMLILHNITNQEITKMECYIHIRREDEELIKLKNQNDLIYF